MEVPQNVREAQLWLLSDILQEEDNTPAPFYDIALLAQDWKQNVDLSPINTRPQVPPQDFGYPVRQDPMTGPTSFTIPNRPEVPYFDQNRVRFRVSESGVGSGWKRNGTGVFIPLTVRGTASSRYRQLYRWKNDAPPPVQEESTEESVDVSQKLCLPPEWIY